MSVLIKGMEMPKNCLNCAVVQYDVEESEYYCPFSNNIAFRDSRRASCPLIEVQTPHGRLIDKDKLRRELFVNFNGERIPFYDCDNFPTTLTYRDLNSILSEQPTVIEADGSEI